MFGDRHIDGARLDAWITGNYGEDYFQDGPDEEEDDDEDDSDPERTPLVGPTTDRIRGSDVMAALLEAQAHCFDEG